MTRNKLVLLAAGGSAALLLGAFAFQYLGGMPPCKLCLWQRWPHGAAIVIGALTLVMAWRALPFLGAAAAAASGGVGLYHTGVERGWWEGPTSCTGTTQVGSMSAEDLLNQIMSAPIVRCDEVPWEMLGLSMASWNAVASFALVALWLMAARRKGA
ncbi:MAG: disulfide bond formation protein B [Brevirhabdus sp.]